MPRARGCVGRVGVGVAGCPPPARGGGRGGGGEGAGPELAAAYFNDRQGNLVGTQ